MAPTRVPQRRHGPVPIAERGPGWSYRPDSAAPSLLSPHQPGIATPQLDHLRLAAFDLTAGRDGLRAVLTAWTAEAEALMRDAAGALTITVGLGDGVFAPGSGLAGARPAALRPLPAFSRDALEPAWCGGDLCLQVCADAPAAGEAALARLTALAAGAARERWIQRGFLVRDDRPGTPRDVLGFKHGSINLRRPRDFDRLVWAGPRDRTWMAGGSYLVMRRIQAPAPGWDALGTAGQEQVIGRRRRTGAPLTGRREFDPVPVDDPRTPADAHARLAQPRLNGGAAMLRRGYSYDDGGDRGLIFLAFARDPQRQVAPVQRRLDAEDALARLTRHVGSAVFAIPPGATPGVPLAGALFTGRAGGSA